MACISSYNCCICSSVKLLVAVLKTILSLTHHSSWTASAHPTYRPPIDHPQSFAHTSATRSRSQSDHRLTYGSLDAIPQQLHTRCAGLSTFLCALNSALM